MNKLFTDLGGKFKFSAQDSDLEYLCWRRKNFPVSSDLKPPLEREREKGKMILQNVQNLHWNSSICKKMFRSHSYSFC